MVAIMYALINPISSLVSLFISHFIVTSVKTDFYCVMSMCVMYKMYVMHVYQINAVKCICTLLNHHFINTVHNSDMYQPLKGRLQGV